ncbi:MAG: D-glycero-beta-D-manno-heptose 1-phosphate adenylyltransferase [bacterium]|nr:D-glycero-beta-D-manno-heptose 1-phosphate adenylyltransferase [bacterium]
MLEKIKTLSELKEIVGQLKKDGKRVVFTNGCFDLLHVGHIRCLKKARELADILVAGLNSDSSVKGLKGDSRPLIPEQERAEILAALECVDYVVIFEEPDPVRVISTLLPDVLVKGDEYSLSEIKGREIVEAGGGEVVRVSLVKGRSTSNLIQQIRYGK